MLLVQFLVKTYRCFVLYVLAEDFDGISVSYEWEIKYKIIIASTSKNKKKNIGRGGGFYENPGACGLSICILYTCCGSLE